MTKPIYTIYKTTNNINNKIYIGVHVTSNPNDSYLGSGIAIKSAIKKYGKSNFTKSILFEYDNPNDMYNKEIELVNIKFTQRMDTYNIDCGGKGRPHNYVVSDKTKEKISKSCMGKIHTVESKVKMSKSHIGKIHSLKTKEKISKSNVGKTIGKNNGNFCGYYITPWGKFESSRLASTEYISHHCVARWCTQNNKIITQQSIGSSRFFQSLKESPLGKTFKEIGFDHQSIE